MGVGRFMGAACSVVLSHMRVSLNALVRGYPVALYSSSRVVVRCPGS